MGPGGGDPRSLERRLPAARSIEITEAGHMVPLTHAGVIAEHLVEFWGED